MREKLDHTEKKTYEILETLSGRLKNRTNILDVIGTTKVATQWVWYRQHNYTAPLPLSLSRDGSRPAIGRMRHITWQPPSCFENTFGFANCKYKAVLTTDLCKISNSVALFLTVSAFFNF
jgi:hypothetical protein